MGEGKFLEGPEGPNPEEQLGAWREWRVERLLDLVHARDTFKTEGSRRVRANGGFFLLFPPSDKVVIGEKS